MKDRVKSIGNIVLNNLNATILAGLAGIIILCLVGLQLLEVALFTTNFLEMLLGELVVDLIALVIGILLVDTIREKNRRQKITNMNRVPIDMLQRDVLDSLAEIVQFIDKQEEVNHLSNDEFVSYVQKNKENLTHQFQHKLLNTDNKSETIHEFKVTVKNLQKRLEEDVNAFYPDPHYRLSNLRFLLNKIVQIMEEEDTKSKKITKELSHLEEQLSHTNEEKQKIRHTIQNIENKERQDLVDLFKIQFNSLLNSFVAIYFATKQEKVFTDI